MSAADQAGLIVATAGLNLIKMLRQAMSTADKSVGGQAAQSAQSGGAALYPTAAFSTPILHGLEIEAPHISALPATHITQQTNVYRPAPASASGAAPSPASCDCQPHPTHQPICLQAPWQIWPWPQPSIALDHFKRAIPVPDTLSKGMLIDIFV
jgi:hypothetical protein